MHMRGRLTRQPLGGPFDKKEPDRDDRGRLDTGLGAGAAGVKGGTFSGATNNTGKLYTPTASSGGGSSAISQPTSPGYRSKTIGAARAYGVLTPAQKNHDSRTLGRPMPYAPGREIEQWRQEAPNRATRAMTAGATNRALNQVAPGSQVRNQ